MVSLGRFWGFEMGVSDGEGVLIERCEHEWSKTIAKSGMYFLMLCHKCLATKPYGIEKELTLQKRTFTCEICFKTFFSSWSESERDKEYENSRYKVKGEDKALLCDKCYKDFNTWYERLTPKERAKIDMEARRNAKKC